MKTMKRLLAKGFTLIELVIVLVILGILAAIIIPKYVNLSSDATTAARLSMEGAVKSAYAICIAENKTAPDLAALVTCAGDGASNSTTGVGVQINGNTEVVRTYTDAGCTIPSSAGNAADPILCVGTIATV